MMMIAIVLIATLLLGFVLGRVWEIRQQIVLAEPRGTRQHAVDGSARAQVSERSQADDSRVLAALDQIREAVTAATLAPEPRSNIIVRRLGSTPYARNP